MSDNVAMSPSLPNAIQVVKPRQTQVKLAAAILLVLCLLALAGVAIGIYAAFEPPAGGIDLEQRARVNRIVQQIRSSPPPAAIPTVETVRYVDVSQEDARLVNASIPFSTRVNPPALPFYAKMSGIDRARAVDCLAAAAWYEAGNDPIGQQAVVQVVLNRMRNAPFPSTACGVVFQGSERRTGCQFSFTCDGAMARTPSASAWAIARGSAIAGIQGVVFRSVGWSTHYHTDWVVPYWSSSVDKTTAVGTHLFFRWRGAAGDPKSFARSYTGNEPRIPALARLSEAHRENFLPTADLTLPAPTEVSPTMSNPLPPAPVPESSLRGNKLASRQTSANAFEVRVDRGAVAGTLALLALDLCRLNESPVCTVFGSLNNGPQVGVTEEGKAANPGAIAFYYFRDTRRGREDVFWDCAIWSRSNARQCLPNDFNPR